MTEAITDALYGRPVLTLAVLLILAAAGLVGVIVTAVVHDQPATGRHIVTEPPRGLSPFPPTPGGEEELERLWVEGRDRIGVLS